MTNYEILKLYKEGKMTKAEVKKKLIEAKNSSFSNIIYLNSVWKKADLDKSLCNDKVENIIVFCENEKQIVIEGYNQINVYKGSGFQKKNDREYVCDPCDRSQVARICKELVGKNNYMIYLWSEPDLLLGSESLFLLFQILMKQGAAKSCRVVMLYDNKNRSCEAFGGFAKSISIENPNVRLHTVSIPKTAKISEVAKSEILYFNDKETEIKYEHNKRYVKELELIENTSRNNANISYQDKTYLITGGAGGLGLIFAKYLSQKGAGKVILTGRSKKSISDDILSVMKKNNTELVYQQLDVCDSSAVQEFVKTLDSKSIAIDGIIHSAGVLRDSYMIKKELADFQAVLKPKVEGVNHLYHAFKDKSLDFFVTFSSIVGVLGNAGQADYATANSYMDNFMQYVTKQNKNWIRAVSINWPFWDNGGMQLSEDNLKYMEQKYGLYPISHKDGLSAFDFSILNNESQVIVINGNPEILSSYISCLKTDKITVTQKKQEIKSSAVSDEVLKKKVADLLKKLIAKETKMKAERISIQVPIEKYGLDSVMMMSISNELETVFGSLRKTLLFEYITIDKLSDYFVEEHRDSIIQKMLSPTENTNTLEAVEPENKVIQTVEDTFYDHREKDSESDDIAIIGLAGKYPMADDYEKLWENLCIGKDCITTVPKDRWDVRPNKKEWGGFINDVDKFDPLLFDMSYKEAALVDPAERIFMENVWSALEDAANTKRRLADKNVGVFVGAMYAQYQFYGVEDYNSEDAKPLNSSLSSIANRISYFFDFHGPSLTVDTMCSSSLTALHFAVKCLKDGECDMAVVGGVNLSLHPYKYFILEENNFTSSDGRCRSFGDGGDGYVPGEGCGTIIIKPLKKAIKDHDFIHAVIKGTSVNHGGHVGGFTVPNPNMQADVISKALQKAKVDPSTIQYVEAHGTGTYLGDPIEIAGLEKAFKGKGNRNRKCAIGSIKSNIGHLEAAAGIAGITKVILQMEHQKLVPSIHSEKLNTKIDFSSSYFQVQRTLDSWVSMEVTPGVRKRRAGISSFGAGGSNAHVIMEDYDNQIVSMILPQNIVPFSARTEKQLLENIDRILEHITKLNDVSDEAFSRFCYTLQEGREQLSYRCAVVCNDFKQLIGMLKEYREKQCICNGVFIGNAWGNTDNIDTMTDIENNTKKAEKLYNEKNYAEIAEKWCSGIDLDWGFIYKNKKITPMSLPNLPFERVSLWLPKKNEVDVYIRELTREDIMIRDHVIKGKNIVPTAYMLEIFADASNMKDAKCICVQNLKLFQPLVVEGEGTKIRITMKPSNPDMLVGLKMFSEDGSILYCSCEIRNKPYGSIDYMLSDRLGSSVKVRRNQEQCYRFFKNRGYQYGETLRLISSIESSEDKIVASVDNYTIQNSKNITEPELLDAAFQATMLFDTVDNNKGNYIPVSVDQIVISRDGSCKDYKIIAEIGSDEKYKVFDIDVLSSDKTSYISIRGLKSINTDEVKTFENKKEIHNKEVQISTDISAVKEMLIHLIAEKLEMPAEEITPQIGFEKIGINSIASSEIISQLDEMFDGLPRTIFYETSNINELAQYLVDNYHEKFVSHDDESKVNAEKQQIGAYCENQDIAIIGISGKYPMADNIEEFWNNLAQGRDCITTIPKERWDLEKYFAPDKDSDLKHYSKWGGFLNNIDKFDPLFFNIAPSQAAMIDPQERLFLNTAWECMEDAGYTPEDLSEHKVGVYVGAMWGLYHLMEVKKDGKRKIPQTTFSSIANRVSYIMNFDGPSMAIDTMCSSSITAIHLACEAIKSGEIQEAIAGGVNLSVHPSKYIQLCQGKFLSADGKCRSFGDGGDGYVPGEGVGAVLLKALPKAIDDNDNIYGVIKASSVNHGGHGNGYTVPNAKKQVDVLNECIRKANIGVDDISYVEAHGTGTELGDPIEVSSLSKVFAGRAEKCPIGSVKSNIGHSEAAAGIAAVTKVLCQLKHNKLAPSIHAKKLNKNIDFQTAKVEVQRTLKDWDRPMNKNRIAVVNSFGAGGSNGCLIIEEYTHSGSNKSYPNSNDEQLLILSAREQERLDDYCNVLLTYLEKDPSQAKTNWDSIIYTLQSGRKSFEYRFAMVCNGYEDALDKLRRYTAGQKDDSIFIGYASEKEILRNVELNDGFDHDIRKCAYNWSNGKYVNWRKEFYRNVGKISLPVYPFAQDSYYAYSSGAMFSSESVESASENDRFQRVIRRTDPVIAEHIMGGRMILPGTFYIAFVNEIFHELYPDEKIELFDVNWKEPFELRLGEAEKKLYVEFDREEKLDFEIFYIENGKKIICVTGKGRKDDSQMLSAIDIRGLMYELREQIPEEEMYHSLNVRNYQYGESYKRTYNIFFNGNEAFASIYESDDQQKFTTDHAAELLDACIRTALCIDGSLMNPDEPLRIPFYMDSFKLYGELKNARYAYAYSDNVVKEQKTQKCNIVISDENGMILACFTNLVSRVLSVDSLKNIMYAHRVEEEEMSENSEKSFLNDTVIFNPSGRKSGFSGHAELEITQDVYHSSEKIKEVLTGISSEEKTVRKFVYISNCAEAFEKFDFELIKKEVRYLTNVLNALSNLQLGSQIQFAYCALYEKELNPFVASVQSYLHSFMMVNAEIKTAVVAVQGNELSDQISIIDHELENIRLNRKGIVIYKNGKKYTTAIKPFHISADSPLLKENGTYLIAGGCGKLGRTIAKYIATKYHASFMLVGRSQMNDSIKECISDIESSGGRASYLQCDICNKNQVKNTIQAAVEQYGCLNGIINMAGTTSGKSILEATDSDIQKVLSGKIAGIENLDNASVDIDLDFFVAFSSVSCIMGDFGECLYSMANEYLNQFIEKRDRLMKDGKRFGQSISVSWPLFDDGTFALPDDKKNIYFSYLGMSTISNEEFTQIFDQSLSLGNNEIMVFCGDKRKIDKLLDSKENIEIVKGCYSDMKEKTTISDNYYSEIAKYLKNIIFEHTGISINRIKEDENLERYGIDSIMIMNMNKAIEKDFVGISKTLFFEYSNIHDMAEYFVNQHRSQLKSFFHIEEEKGAEPAVVQAEQKIRFTPRFIDCAAPKPSQKIAIIGASGKFPKANDLDEFWEVFKNGIDCIEEVPGERWSIEKYYSEDKTEEGKTYCKWGGFVKDADKFDPLFFNIAPYQAEKMDPQERIFLETAWSAIEDAGYTRDSLKDNSVGVFVGAMYAHYQMLAEDEYLKGNTISVSSYLSTIANRVSYVMDFNGPSVTVDTACSSSLEAIRLGCLNIQSGDCDMALVGGVNLSLHPQKYIFLCQSNFLASDGRCHSYEDNGDGYVPGEGVGAILLKPLEAAERDNDHIYAVINSIAANHGGKTGGYTVPNPNAQSAVIEQAIKKANIDPKTISYIEGHGTGTILGDPIEVTGLTKAFQAFTQERNFCALGSAKANIGHLESAAGIAGIMKILLQMKYKMIPPLAGPDDLNPNINFDETPFYIPRELQEWKRPIVYKNGKKTEAPLRAGVNAFGAGGANVHVELEEYVDSEISPDVQDTCVIVLSAKNIERLKEYAKKIAAYIEHNKAEYSEASEVAEENIDLLKQLHQIVADCLDLPCEVVEAEDDLLELGVDQISIEKIKNMIQKTFNTDVTDEFMRSKISIHSISEKLGIKKTLMKSQKRYTIRMDELAYTLQTGREQMEYRLGFTATDLDEVAERLKEFAEQDDRSNILVNVIGKSEDGLALFSDEDGKEIINIFIRKNRIEKLLSLWVRGINVDWKLLYQGRNMKKISLPTYPFERKRYYIDVTDSNVTVVNVPKRENKTIVEQEKQYTYEANWFWDSKYNVSDNSNWKSVLICYHKSAEKFAKALGAYHNNADVKYHEFNSGELVVKTSLSNIERVYFIGDVEYEADTDYSDKKCLTTLQALFALLKIAYRGNRPNSICVCSNMAYVVHKEDNVNPYAGGTYGFIHSIEKEYTDISFSYFDLDVYKKGIDYDEAYAKNIIPLISGKEKSMTEHAVRNGYVFCRSIYPMVLQEKATVLKESGVYVVFGGMGSVGRDLTKYLLDTHKATVAIIGKRELDDKRCEILKNYEGTEGTASYYQADICNIEELKTVLGQIEGKYGHIDGIFNSTMVFREKSFSELKKSEFEETVRIKIAGNSNLLKATEEIETGFIIVFSSVQAFNGNQGRVHYSTACDFADQYLHYVGMNHKCPVKIINWGFWGNYDGKPLEEEYVKELNEKGVFPLEPAYGMKMLETILANDLKQVLVFHSKQYVLDLMHVKEHRPECIYTDILQYETDQHYEFEPKVKNDINKFCCIGAIKILQSLGLFKEKANSYTKEDIYNTELKQGKYKQLLEAVIAIAVKAGYVKDEGAVLSATKKVTGDLKKMDQFEQQIDKACVSYKELDGYLRILKHCVHEMPYVLEGNKSAEEVLFPNSKMDLVEGVYKTNKMSTYLNKMLAVGIKSYIEQKIPMLAAGEKITILEIGVGTGSSSETVLEYIAPYGEYIQYIYSDISTAFLLHGKSRFQEKYSFIDYELLNVENDLLTQNVAANSIDVVFGTNVFHATKSIHNTLANIRKSMKNNGLFMLNEGTQTIDVLTLTFGMLAGWWLFEDEEIRIPHSPLLTSESWIKALSDCGYADFLNLESVICARANGEPVGSVRKELPAASKKTEEASGDLYEQKIIKILMDVLKLDLEDIEVDRNIMDYGVDSILVVKIIAEIKDSCDVQLMPDVFFDCATIENLVKYIKNEKQN